MKKLSNRRAMLVGALAVLIVGTAIGTAIQAGNGIWYRSLVKPGATPPGFVFGIVWPLLYLLIGAAGGLIWAAREHPARRRALFWYALQLALNFLWMPVFFGLQQIQAGLGVIAALNVAAIFATIRMGAVRGSAAWLMLPYLLWIGYAAVLNLRIWQLNPYMTV